MPILKFARDNSLLLNAEQNVAGLALQSLALLLPRNKHLRDAILIPHCLPRLHHLRSQILMIVWMNVTRCKMPRRTPPIRMAKIYLERKWKSA